MLVIYNKPVNFILRTVLKPFSSVLPAKFHIPVNGTYTVKIDSQTTIKIVVNATSYLGQLLFWGGVKGFEYDSVRIFMALAEKSKTIFDIGANFGYYSLLAAALNKEAEVYGFEPMPDANHYFHLNKETNHFSNIKIEELALSNVNAELEFTAIRNPKFESEKYHIGGDSGLGVLEGRHGQLIKVKAVTLDGYVQQNNIKRIDLIKIDVEASEHLVLGGAKNVLTQLRPIIQSEVLHDKIEGELEKIFTENNYLFFKPTPKGLVPAKSLTDSKEDKADYYFVPKEKIEMVREFIISN